VSYSRQIPSGEEGKITIKVNTKGYGGRTLKKVIKVLTDDKQTPQFDLHISGKVDKFVTIAPRVVRFNGKVGDKLKQTVTIVPEEKYFFSITDVSAKTGDNIKFTLKNIKVNNLKSYTLNIENLMTTKGSYHDVLTIKTDSKIQPELKLNVMARIVDPNDKNDKKDLSVKEKQKSNFLEVIKKMQQQKKTNGKDAPVSEQDRAKKEELKKKFEALIKKAMEKNKIAKDKVVKPQETEKSQPSEAN